MISPEPEDRYGAPRWKLGKRAQQPPDREKVYFAVSRNLLGSVTNSPAAVVDFRQFCEHVAPIVVELLWLRDRVELLEKQHKTLRQHLINLRSGADSKEGTENEAL